MLSFGEKLKSDLQITFPMIMAPMFLVSNKAMLQAGMRAGIMTTFPTLNYRKENELAALLDDLNQYKAQHSGSYGVNLIVQKTNIFFEKHLQICCDKKVPFYITSLGNPSPVIEAAHSYGAKVYCDITNLTHAEKCYKAGCDGFIAVGQGAGGHAGPHPLQVLIPALKKKFPDTVIVAAGGIAHGNSLLSLQILGAEGVSVGTRFIASTECDVKDEYKQAIINAGMDDIVMTSKLSGTPATIINTPTAKKLGYEQNRFEKFMSTNPRLKKWFKMLVQVRGMKKLEQSLLPNNYLQLWCAGKSSELINEIMSCEDIISQFKKEYTDSIQKIKAAKF